MMDIEKNTNFAVHYKEELQDGQLCFNGYFAQIGNLEAAYGHFEYDSQGALYSDSDDNIPKLETKADFWLDKTIEIVNGRINC